MGVLNAADMADMVKVTLRKLPKNKFSQFAQELQRYEFMGKWLRKGQVDFEAGGYGIEEQFMDQTEERAEEVGLFHESSVHVGDHMGQIKVDWRHYQVPWGYDYLETLMNKGARTMINKLVVPRRAGARIDLAQLLENRAWDAPPVGDTERMYGVLYWIVKNATTGFNGGYPGSHTAIGGVSLTTSPNFKNFTGEYTDVTEDDLMDLWYEAYDEIQWESPVTEKDFYGDFGTNLRWYVNGPLKRKLEKIVRNRNDDLGPDLAKFHGATVFKNHALIYVPKLNDDTTDPIYGIDHKAFRVKVLTGDYLREDGPMRSPRQRNVWEIWLSLSLQTICIDRRRNMVLSTA